MPYSEAKTLFRSVIKSSSGVYSLEADAKGSLPRGAMCPAVIEEISLPPAGSVVLDPVEVAPELHRFCNNATECMLLDEDQVDWKQWKTIKPYSEPTFRCKETMLELTLRMWRADMLRPVEEKAAGVSLSTVVKKNMEDVAGNLIQVSRLTWDERATNALFRRPPTMRLGLATSLCHTDAST